VTHRFSLICPCRARRNWSGVLDNPPPILLGKSRFSASPRSPEATPQLATRLSVCIDIPIDCLCTHRGLILQLEAIGYLFWAPAQIQFLIYDGLHRGSHSSRLTAILLPHIRKPLRLLDPITSPTLVALEFPAYGRTIKSKLDSYLRTV